MLPEPATPRVPWRAILLGALFLPPLNLLGMHAYIVSQTGNWTALALLRGPLALLLLAALARRLPLGRARFDRAELAALFSVLSVGTALSGVGWAVFLVPCLAGGPGYWAEHGFRGWSNWLEWVPAWFMTDDTAVIADIQRGYASLYTAEAWRALRLPLLTWTGFLLCLAGAQQALAQLVARAWIERERLTFPMTILPLEMLRDDGGLLRDRRLWLGFALAGAAELWNGAAFLHPALPAIPLKVKEWPQPTDGFWRGTGSLWTAAYPFLVGVGYLLPQDVSLSVWFFFLLTRLADALAVAGGYRAAGGWAEAAPPYHLAQNTGAVLTLAALALWRIRGDLAGAFRGASRGALLGLALCALGFVVLCGQAAMPLMAVAGWLLLYLLVALTMARLVAESGAPSAISPHSPRDVFYALGGRGLLPPRNLTSFVWLHHLDETFADAPVVHCLAGLRLQHDLGRSTRPMHAALAVGALVGVVSGLWALLHLYFQRGIGTASVMGWAARSMPQKPFVQLTAMLSTPYEPKPGLLGGMAAGALVTLLLVAARARWAGFALHPIGYCISGNWSLQERWFPFALAWAAKRAALRLGGIRFYRRSLPFVLGVILGDLVVPVAWSIAGAWTGQPMYSPYPH